jgi:hypothetical protein
MSFAPAVSCEAASGVDLDWACESSGGNSPGTWRPGVEGDASVFKPSGVNTWVGSVESIVVVVEEGKNKAHLG